MKQSVVMCWEKDQWSAEKERLQGYFEGLHLPVSIIHARSQGSYVQSLALSLKYFMFLSKFLNLIGSHFFICEIELVNIPHS